jgi:hypothetical protein
VIEERPRYRIRRSSKGARVATEPDIGVKIRSQRNSGVCSLRS